MWVGWSGGGSEGVTIRLTRDEAVTSLRVPKPYAPTTLSNKHTNTNTPFPQERCRAKVPEFTYCAAVVLHLVFGEETLRGQK